MGWTPIQLSDDKFLQHIRRGLRNQGIEVIPPRQTRNPDWSCVVFPGWFWSFNEQSNIIDLPAEHMETEAQIWRNLCALGKILA